jgi:hypothetical protein
VNWPVLYATLSSTLAWYDSEDPPDPLPSVQSATILIPFVQLHGVPPDDEFTESENWRFHDVGLGAAGVEDVYTNTLPADDDTIQDAFIPPPDP